MRGRLQRRGPRRTARARERARLAYREAIQAGSASAAWRGTRSMCTATGLD
jgi:hypothetical protein